MRLESKKIFEFLVVSAIVCGLFVLGRLSLPEGPVGRNVPTEEPDESRRVRSTSGISIVLPVNWQADLGSDAKWAWVRLWPKGPPRRCASIIVQSLTEAPNLDGFNKTTFRGEEAFEKITIDREWTFDDPAQSRYELYFQEDDQWYQIGYVSLVALRELPKSVRRYFETLRIERQP